MSVVGELLEDADANTSTHTFMYANEHDYPMPCPMLKPKPEPKPKAGGPRLVQRLSLIRRICLSLRLSLMQA